MAENTNVLSDYLFENERQEVWDMLDQDMQDILMTLPGDEAKKVLDQITSNEWTGSRLLATLKNYLEKLKSHGKESEKKDPLQAAIDYYAGRYRDHAEFDAVIKLVVKHGKNNRSKVIGILRKPPEEAKAALLELNGDGESENTSKQQKKARGRRGKRRGQRDQQPATKKGRAASFFSNTPRLLMVGGGLIVLLGTLAYFFLFSSSTPLSTDTFEFVEPETFAETDNATPDTAPDLAQPAIIDPEVRAIELENLELEAQSTDPIQKEYLFPKPRSLLHWLRFWELFIAMDFWVMIFFVIFTLYAAERRSAGETQDVKIVGAILITLFLVIPFSNEVSLILAKVAYFMGEWEFAVSGQEIIVFGSILAFFGFLIATIQGRFDLTSLAVGSTLLGMLIFWLQPANSSNAGAWLLVVGFVIEILELVRPQTKQKGETLKGVAALMISVLFMVLFFPFRNFFIWVVEKGLWDYVQPATDWPQFLLTFIQFNVDNSTLVGFLIAAVVGLALTRLLAESFLNQAERLISRIPGTDNIQGLKTVSESTRIRDATIVVFLFFVNFWSLSGSL